MTHLLVTLAVNPRGVFVTWLLDGVVLNAGETLGQLPLSIAGAPTLHLEDEIVTAKDALGAVPLVVSVPENDDGEPRRRWTVGRSTSGSIEVSYLAEPVVKEPLPVTAPLELRGEGVGLSGALKCLLVLPPGPEDLTFALRWNRHVGQDRTSDGWMAITSLGEGEGRNGELAGMGLELLGDTYVMCGGPSSSRRRALDLVADASGYRRRRRTGEEIPRRWIRCGTTRTASTLFRDLR